MNLRNQSQSAKPNLKSAPGGTFVPPMQVHRPGALDYQTKPSLVQGVRVPYKTIAAMTSSVPEGISYAHGMPAK